MAAALEIPTGERRAFLDVACGADEELRREVESLLGVAETGSVCITTNEGNGRLTTSVPRIHVALMGIERLVP